MNYRLITLLLFLLFCLSGNIVKAASKKIDFNRDWYFVKSQTLWVDDFNLETKIMEAVNQAHTWNAYDMGFG